MGKDLGNQRNRKSNSERAMEKLSKISLQKIKVERLRMRRLMEKTDNDCMHKNKKKGNQVDLQKVKNDYLKKRKNDEQPDFRKERKSNQLKKKKDKQLDSRKRIKNSQLRIKTEAKHRRWHGKSKVVRKAEDSLEWLPTGWTVETKARKRGALAGYSYKVYRHPGSGFKLYSKKDVFRYLGAAGLQIHAYEKKRNISSKTKKCIATMPKPKRTITATEVDACTSYHQETSICKKFKNSSAPCHQKGNSDTMFVHTFASSKQEERIKANLNYVLALPCQKETVKVNSKIVKVNSIFNTLSSCRSPATVFTNRARSRFEYSPDGIPPGWIRETRFRKTYSRHSRKDLYYIDPATGYMFRSLKDVSRYMENGDVGQRVYRVKEGYFADMYPMKKLRFLKELRPTESTIRRCLFPKEDPNSNFKLRRAIGISFDNQHIASKDEVLNQRQTCSAARLLDAEATRCLTKKDAGKSQMRRQLSKACDVDKKSQQAQKCQQEVVVVDSSLHLNDLVKRHMETLLAPDENGLPEPDEYGLDAASRRNVLDAAFGQAEPDVNRNSALGASQGRPKRSCTECREGSAKGGAMKSKDNKITVSRKAVVVVQCFEEKDKSEMQRQHNEAVNRDRNSALECERELVAVDSSLQFNNTSETQRELLLGPDLSHSQENKLGSAEEQKSASGANRERLKRTCKKSPAVWTQAKLKKAKTVENPMLPKAAGEEGSASSSYKPEVVHRVKEKDANKTKMRRHLSKINEWGKKSAQVHDCQRENMVVSNSPLKLDDKAGRHEEALLGPDQNRSSQPQENELDSLEQNSALFPSRRRYKSSCVDSPAGSTEVRLQKSKKGEKLVLPKRVSVPALETKHINMPRVEHLETGEEQRCAPSTVIQGSPLVASHRRHKRSCSNSPARLTYVRVKKSKKGEKSVLPNIVTAPTLEAKYTSVARTEHLDSCREQQHTPPSVILNLLNVHEIIEILRYRVAALKLNEDKPELFLQFPLEDSWGDPCIEFAVKTLTNDIPALEDPSWDYFDHQASEI